MTTQTHSAHIPDARPDNWVDRAVPVFARPYLKLMRADRPVGVWLLFWPCLFGLALTHPAADHWTELAWYTLLFFAGASVMRGAGCTYNDIVDAKIDAQVARTRARPIPSGAVSKRAAWVFAILLALTGFAVLVQFNLFTIGLGIASLALVAAYPFMKRITWWPQAWLGLTFNWGALVGWSALTGGLGLAPLLLYAGCVFWTIGYDTIYAHQDREDDALIGVKSSALRLGHTTKPWLVIFYGAAWTLWLAAGLTAGLSSVFALGMAGVAVHLGWQIWKLDIDRPVLCLKLFKANIQIGPILTAGLALGHLHL